MEKTNDKQIVDQINNEIMKRFKEFDDSYEELEVQPYNCCRDYFKYGALNGIEMMQSEVDEAKNNYLRALADSENVRKNFAKKQADLYTYQYENIMKDMLDILDDIDRGVAAGEFSNGGMLVFGKLGKTLERYGLKQIKPNTGDEFDSDNAEAISVISVPNMKNKIVDCTQVGYSYKDKIIRYPKVVVGA